MQPPSLPFRRHRSVPPVMTIKNASRLCPMSPGEQNCPRWRSTVVTDHVTLERSVLDLKSRRKLHTACGSGRPRFLSAFAGLLLHAVDEGGLEEILSLFPQVSGETKPVFIKQRASLGWQHARGVPLQGPNGSPGAVPLVMLFQGPGERRQFLS